MTTQRISGFEFGLKFGRKVIWAQVQGYGGQLGNGYLASINCPDTKTDMDKVQKRLLRSAQVQLKRDGDLLVLKNWDLPPSERFEKLVPDEVVGVRTVQR